MAWHKPLQFRMEEIVFSKSEVEQFRSEQFDPFFRSDTDTDHWRKNHERHHIERYSRRQLFWLLDADYCKAHDISPLKGYKMVIKDDPPIAPIYSLTQPRDEK